MINAREIEFQLPQLTVSTGAIYAAKPEGGEGFPTIRVAMMDRDEAQTAPIERDDYLHQIVHRCNEFPRLLQAAMAALEFMERVEAKEWEDGEAETMPEVDEFREFITSIE